MGAEDFSYHLQTEPGCYFHDRQRRRQPPRGGHGPGPCMLHNPSYDFNDELIRWRHRLGAHRRDLAEHAEMAMNDAADAFAQSYAGRRARSSSPRRKAAGLDVETTPTRCSGATARRWRWTWRCEGARRCEGAADRQQRLPRRGLLRLGRAACAARRRPAVPRQASGGGALHPRAQPWGFSWWRRTTQENVDLNRNFHDFRSRCPPTRATRHRVAAGAARAGRRGRGDAALRATSPHTAMRARCSRPPAASTIIPRAMFFGGRNPPEPSRCATCCWRHGRQCAAAGWIDFHTGLGPQRRGRAHLRLPRRCRGAGARASLVGANAPDLRRQLDLGAC